MFRNELHAHITEIGISTKEFEHYWNEISPVLVSLGIDQKEVNRLKTEECEKEVVERIKSEWSIMDEDIRRDLERINTTLNENLRINVEGLQEVQDRLNKLEDDTSLTNREQKETRKAIKKLQEGQRGHKQLLTNILEQQEFSAERLAEYAQFKSDAKSIKSDEDLKKLAECDFSAERKILCSKFVQGTREWVFDQVNEWFNDDTSESRAFIITGEAGMGKSVIAAVVCERMREQLAGCYFFRCTDCYYHNPKVLLQSLARQISEVLPEYKVALIDQLSHTNLTGKTLNEMNIESFFTILLKEPFAHVNPPVETFCL